MADTCHFRTSCRAPTGLTPEQGVRFFGEGSACFWLWIWPELIGWPDSVAWLFSPVVGNTTWPGDLWGVDAAGRLVIVEAKTCKPGTRVDPFADFVGPGASVADGTSPAVEASALRTRWLALLQKERRFIRDHGAALRDGTSLEDCYPGVVPYSRHRASVQRWCHLYLERLADELNGPGYEDRVDQYLRTRKRHGDPVPHVVALLAVVDGGVPRLSATGRRNLLQLRDVVGADRVGAVVVRGRRAGESVEITAGPASIDGA